MQLQIPSIEEIQQAVETALENYFKTNPSLQNQSEQDEIGGVKDAARWTNYAESTVYDLAHKRVIPHSKRGKRLIFSRNELTAWLQENRRRTQTELTAEAGKITA